MQFNCVVSAREVRRNEQPVACALAERSRAHHALPRHRAGFAVRADAAAHSRHGDLRRPVVPHVLLAAGTGRTRRQTRGRCRHRRHGRAGDRRSLRHGGRSNGFPTAARTGARRSTTARSPTRRWPPSARATTRSSPRACARPAVSNTSPIAAASGKCRAKSALEVVGQAVRRTRLRHLAQQFPRDLHGRERRTRSSPSTSRTAFGSA